MNNASMLHEIDQEHEDLLTLSLSTRQTPPNPPHSSSSSSPPPLLIPTSSQPMPLFVQIPPPPPPPPPFDFNLPHNSHYEAPAMAHPARIRRAPVQALRNGKSEFIPPPYPWAQDKRATVHSLEYLLGNGMQVIRGLVQCKKCDQSYEIEYNLRQKFMEIAGYVSEHRGAMHDRAPAAWMNPTLPNCKLCDQNNCMKPVITKKRSINWLFLLLGEMLGCCKLSELKYFCKHTKNHRTGAKDRVLYLTYLGLCKQLDPSGPFDILS